MSIPQLSLARLKELAASKGRKHERATLIAGLTARNISIDAVAGANTGWVAGRIAVIKLIRPGTVFSTDRLWVGAPAIGEPRAMGAVIAEAIALGLIKATGEWEKSSRPQCHARDVKIWRRV